MKRIEKRPDEKAAASLLDYETYVASFSLG